MVTIFDSRPYAGIENRALAYDEFIAKRRDATEARCRYAPSTFPHPVRIDARIEEVDSRFDKLEARLDELNVNKFFRLPASSAPGGKKRLLYLVEFYDVDDYETCAAGGNDEDASQSQGQTTACLEKNRPPLHIRLRPWRLLRLHLD
ncbi:hypothetical protein HD806DRAFT_533405 [Xylariaceae sp. AK1471]|nr:hypothetical protein HD806DRAFT_533405 [Xylariaceae sp. AK1471]